MSIRYFATNRDNENLGRNESRDKRIKLQRGGYHFVDMHAYMSHYLAEVENETIPASANVVDSQTEVMDNYLANPRIGNIVVCVHGFNVKFHEAQTWFSILTDSMRHTSSLQDDLITDPLDGGKDQKKLRAKSVKPGSLTAFIGFSWPSNGNVFSYNSDQTEAIRSAASLANLIARLRLLPNQPSINLLCHSMGNFLVCHMLRQLVNQEILPQPSLTRPEQTQYFDDLEKRIHRLSQSEAKSNNWKNLFFVDRYIMLAPDIERRHVSKCIEDPSTLHTDQEQASYVGPFYSGLWHLVGEAHNFYSRFDSALALSNIEKDARKIAIGAKDILDNLTFNLLDFLQRNPDQKWEQRLGATQQPINAPGNLHSHNAVEISGREINHSDYIDSHEIVTTIANILTSPVKRK